MDDKAAKAKEIVGYATGDRRVEAEGRLQEEKSQQVTEDEVADEQLEVRQDHGEYQPERLPD